MTVLQCVILFFFKIVILWLLSSASFIHCSLHYIQKLIWSSLSVKKCRNPCSGAPPVYQDLSTHQEFANVITGVRLHV